ncbi:hypothetical protein GF325_12365 [Candidatus Bathyarchaeota archaeon]|nr:hypothetical protein [Candidatus Bathyarchaeota archaeon]
MVLITTCEIPRNVGEYLDTVPPSRGGGNGKLNWLRGGILTCMSRDIYKEAEEILASFQEFWAVDDDIRHLYGIVERTGVKEFIAELFFPADFPRSPPELRVSQNITELLGRNIELKSLQNWNENSRTVDVLKELKMLIDSHIEDDFLELKPKPAPKHRESDAYSEFATPEPFEFHGDEESPSVRSVPRPEEQPVRPESGSPAGTSSTLPASMQGRRIASLTSAAAAAEARESLGAQAGLESERVETGQRQPSRDVASTVSPQAPGDVPEGKQWSEEHLAAEAAKAAAESGGLIDEAYWEQQERKQSRGETPATGRIEPEPPEIIEEVSTLTGDPERDARIREEHEMIMMEYSIDYQTNIADINVYLTISVTSTFIININFIDYPEQPRITYPDTLLSLLPNPDSMLETLKKWNRRKPPHVVEILRELETRLWSLNDIEDKLKRIFGEFEASYLPGSKTAVRVTLLTYGFKEYQVTMDLRNYPSRPSVQYGPRLGNLMKRAPEQLKVMQNWDESGEKEAVAILREINWLVDKESRMEFELDLLQGSLKDVRYDPLTHVILAKMKGTMKTEEETFEFKASLPDNYPLVPPSIELVTELPDEKMGEKIDASLKKLLTSWIPQSSYLIDAFNAVSKAIFEVSVITCIICHQFECPACGMKMDSPDLNEETCKAQCSFCERMYHKHCWDQTIASFGKCGFCLRPPPPGST